MINKPMSGPNKSAYSYCCFDSALHCSNHTYLAFGSRVPSLDPCHPGSNLYIAFRFPSSVAALPTVRSGVQRRTITELFKDARPPLANLFLMESMKNMSYGLSQSGWVGLNWQVQSNISISFNLWIPCSTLKQGISGISNWFTVGPSVVHVSANNQTSQILF